MFAAESLLLDQKNPQAALDALATVTPPEGNRFLVGRKATLQADAYEAAGQKDQAMAVLEKGGRRLPEPPHAAASRRPQVRRALSRRRSVQFEPRRPRCGSMHVRRHGRPCT